MIATLGFLDWRCFKSTLGCCLFIWLFTVATVSAATDVRLANAAMQDDRDAVHALIAQKADVNGAQGDGMAALHWAALKG